MFFQKVEERHEREDLIWFKLSAKPAGNMLEQAIEQVTNVFFSNLPSYELNLLIDLRLDTILFQGKSWEFGIQEGVLELWFVNAKLPRESRTLITEYSDFITVDGEESTGMKWDIGGEMGVSEKKGTEIKGKGGIGGNSGNKEKYGYEIRRVEINGNEKNHRITFNAERINKDKDQVFNGRFIFEDKDKNLGILELLDYPSEIHAIFRVPVNGLCAAAVNGTPIKARNLQLLVTRFTKFSNPIEEKLKTLTGDLSYVKLSAS